MNYAAEARQRLPKNRRRYFWTHEEKCEMAKLYDGGMTLREVSVHFKCSVRTIEHHLKVMRVEMRPRGMSLGKSRAKVSGENHRMWKGGRYSERDYWLIRVNKPTVRINKYATRSERGYMLEHRWVMQNHLLKTNSSHPALKNGSLRETWVVHHKNGIRKDNRIENLEVLPRSKHHSWMHFRDEMDALKKRVGELEMQVNACRIPLFAV